MASAPRLIPVLKSLTFLPVWIACATATMLPGFASGAPFFNGPDPWRALIGFSILGSLLAIGAWVIATVTGAVGIRRWPFLKNNAVAPALIGLACFACFCLPQLAFGNRGASAVSGLAGFIAVNILATIFTLELWRRVKKVGVAS